MAYVSTQVRYLRGLEVHGAVIAMKTKRLSRSIEHSTGQIRRDRMGG